MGEQCPYVPLGQPGRLPPGLFVQALSDLCPLFPELGEYIEGILEPQRTVCHHKSLRPRAVAPQCKFGHPKNYYGVPASPGCGR
jgi:hypothetical protein